ncbi:MAG: crosslink repair DNA glycosylase YcaQ family protein [Vicinamibacterales bacterium]
MKPSGPRPPATRTRRLDRLSLAQARRIALAAQGMHLSRPSRPDARHIRSAIARLGLVQLDYVNVLGPAHYHVLFSRLGPYSRATFDELAYRRREYVEHVAHEASLVPVAHWPLLRARLGSDDRRARALERFLAAHAAYAAEVLALVRDRGPMPTEEVPVPDEERDRPRDWWGWSLAKATLEAHCRNGSLAIADRRPNFGRVYDLASRVVPAEHLETTVAPRDAVGALLRASARALGVATAADLADYYRLKLGVARPGLAELVETGDVSEVQVEGWADRAYLARDAACPASIGASALLSPFDPLVWFRPRTARLFGFDYRLEIFVPQARRRWGYYVLPFLLGDRLVARVDLKAERRTRQLLVLSAYLESHASSRRVAPALAAELATLARWLDLDSVVVADRSRFARDLASPFGARARPAAQIPASTIN